MAKKIKQSEYGIRLLKNDQGEFWFQKKAENHEPVSRSTELYKTKQGALKGLKVDTLITLANINDVTRSPLTLVYLDCTGKITVEKSIVIR